MEFFFHTSCLVSAPSSVCLCFAGGGCRFILICTTICVRSSVGLEPPPTPKLLCIKSASTPCSLSNKCPWRTICLQSLTVSIIHHSSSPARAGFLSMKKKGGSLCPSTDYHGLNETIIKNRYPLLCMSSEFKVAQRAKFFKQLDLHNPCYLVHVQKRERGITVLRGWLCQLWCEVQKPAIYMQAEFQMGSQGTVFSGISALSFLTGWALRKVSMRCAS